MRILIVCEESQAVCIEMRKRGHEAYSCDIQDCTGGHPEWHIKGDALELLKLRWDMIIAHPPCTYLSCAGAQRTFPKAGVPDPVRYAKGEEAAKFFMQFWNADCPRVVIENPLPMRCFGLPKYSQIIHPYMFGDPWYKRTCLWIRGVAPLAPMEAPVEPTGYWVNARVPVRKDMRRGHSDPAMRSKTFHGIARAMAEQWTDDLSGGAEDELD